MVAKILTKMMVFAVLIGLFSVSQGYSFSVSDIFVSLDKNVAGLTGGYAEFTLKSPVTISVDASKLNFYTRWNSTPTTSMKIYIQKNVSYQTPVYISVLINKTCVLPNGSVDCSYYNTTQNGTTTAYKLDWVSLGTESFVANNYYKFRVEATWKAPQKVNDVYSVSRDWIPYINVLGTYYNMSSWAWWNSTRSNMVEVNFTSTFANYTDVELWLILNSTILGANPVTDVVYANDTEVTWLNTTSGLEQSIYYWFENYTDGGNSWLWLKMPVFNTAINNTIRIYYKSADVTRLSTYDATKVFRKHYDFENYTDEQEISSDFAKESGVLLRANTTDSFRGDVSIFSDSLVNGIVFGFGTREFDSGILEAWFKTSSSPSDASIYLYNGINGTLGSQLASVGGMTLPISWTKLKLQYNKTKANFSIGANLYTSFSAYSENISQTMFPYYPIGKWMDEVRLRTYVPDEIITRTFSSVTTLPSIPKLILTQVYPNNFETNTTNNIYFGYHILMNGTILKNCSLYINGTLTKSNATALVNDSINSIYYDFANSGAYAWSIGCRNETATTFTSNRTLTLLEYVSNGTTTAYELSSQPFNLTLSFSNYTYSNVRLTYNNTIYSASSTSPSFWLVNVTLPMVSINYTNVSYYWTYNRTNATHSANMNSEGYSQGVFIAYYQRDGTPQPASVIEGGTLTLYFAVKNYSSSGTKSIYVTIDGVNKTATYIGYNNSMLNYSYSFITSQVSGTISKNYTWYLSVLSAGQSRVTSSTTSNVTIYGLSVTNCVTGLPSLVYVTYDEETGTYLNDSDYYAKVSVTSGSITKTFSFYSTLANNLTLCVYPDVANFTADVSLLYSGHSNVTYSQRTWYDYGITLDNESEEINIYLLNNTRSDLISIETRDQYGNIAPNVLIEIQRFNYTSNSYVNVTKVLTTALGTGLTYLVQYDVPYKLILKSTSGVLYSTYENFFITSSSVVLRTATSFVNVYAEFLQIEHSCSYDDGSKIITCSYTDAGEVISRVEFRAYERFNYVDTLICGENSTSYSHTFTCDISAVHNTSKGFYYYMNAFISHSPTEELRLDFGVINMPDSLLFGSLGVILALVLYCVAYFIGLSFRPIVALMFGTAVIFLSWMMRLINFGTMETLVFGTLLVLSGFVAYKMK